MSTVVPTSTEDSKESVSQRTAPKKVLKDIYQKVLNALRNNKKLILVTGNTSKGKTALLHTICKDISAEYRLISLTGKDIPENEINGDIELNPILDFILESTTLNENLVVTLDDAHLFPIFFLSNLLSHENRTETKKQGLQILLTGPENFKDQLLSIDDVNAEELVYCTIETLTESEILKKKKNKTYIISSNIKNIKFAQSALGDLSEFIQSDEEILDVILEWCAALAKKDQLTSISSKTISRACEFAKQFAKDRHLNITKAYPPSHEVYKYINAFQSEEAPSQETSNESEQVETEKKSSNKNSKTTKIPTINPSLESSQEIKQVHLENKNTQIKNYSDKDSLQVKWTPAKKNKKTTTRNSSSPLVVLISILLICFITFIAYRIDTDPKPDVAKKEHTAVDSSKSNAAIDEVIKKDELSTETERKVIANNLNSEKAEIKKPFVAPLVLGEISNLDPANNSSAKNEMKPDNEKEISNLLVLAEQQLNNKQLTTPVGANALETYQKVLSREPNNKAALDGIKSVHDKYMSWAVYYHERNDLDRAMRFYNKALSIDPNNNLAYANLIKIQDKDDKNSAIALANVDNPNVEDALPSSDVQRLLNSADEKMLQIESDVSQNKRSFQLFQEAQNAYQAVLRYEPNNTKTKKNLSSLANHYTLWADQQAESRNYNIAIFLYGQALNLQPKNAQLLERIEQVHNLKEKL